MSIIIKEARTGTVLAQGEQGSDVIGYEGNLYFVPSAVNQGVLTVTQRTYTCPYKGTCNWVDYTGPGGSVIRDVAWVYPQVKPGHELIQGRFGFYAGVARGHAAGGSLRVNWRIPEDPSEKLEDSWWRGVLCVIVLLTSRVLRARLPSDLPVLGPGAG